MSREPPAASKYARSPQPGGQPTIRPRLTLVQVPTTAGTGSEVTPISILTTPDDQKKGVVSDLLYPDLAVLDELFGGLPAFRLYDEF